MRKRQFQRSKQELLNALKSYKVFKRDEETGKDIRIKTAYWVNNVIWVFTLWQDEKFSRKAILEFLDYVSTNNTSDMDKTRRDELRAFLATKVDDFTFKNVTKRRRHENAVDDVVYRLEYHNVEVSVDYALLACEWLIKNKGYASKRLHRVCGSVLYLDNQPMEVKVALRKDIYEGLGMWIELSEDDKPEDIEASC